MDRSWEPECLRYLRKFAHEAAPLYIYGAGAYARIYKEILDACDIHLDGFVVSSENHEDSYLGLKLVSASEVQATEGLRVIAGFRGARMEDLKIQALRRTQCLFLTNKMFHRLQSAVFVVMPLQKLVQKYPAAPLPEGKLPLKNILVLRLDVIGDLLFTVPFLRELRRNYPEAHITFVIWEKMQGLMQGCPYVDEVIAYSCRLQEGRLSAELADFDARCKDVQAFLAGHLSARTYDIVFLPRLLFAGRNRIDEFAMAVMSGARYRIGRFDDYLDPEHGILEPHLGHWMSFVDFAAEQRHEVAHMLELLRACGCEVLEERMEYWLPPEDIAFAEKICNEHDAFRYVACGLVSRDARRTWAAENYRELIERFGGTPVRFLLLGGKDAKEAASIIGNRENVIDLTGETALPQAAAIVSLSDLYLGSNTGLLHFASAAGVPVVEVSAWLSDGDPMEAIAPQRMGPWGVPAISLVPGAGLDECHGQCSKPYAHCINTITVDAVEEAVREMVGGSRDKKRMLLREAHRN